MEESEPIEGLKVFTSIEKERSKIAVILQEDIAQLVAIAKLRLVGSPEVATYLKEAVAKLTSLAFEIKPQVLENFGLISALEELLNRRIGAGKYQIVIAEKTNEQIHPTLQIVVFRLIQQLLNNPYKSVISCFLVQVDAVVDYICIKINFDIAFYSDTLQVELLEEIKLSIAPLVYLFNGYHVVETHIDEVHLTIYVKSF